MFNLKQSTRPRLVVGILFGLLLSALVVSLLAGRSNATDAASPVDSFSVLTKASDRGLAAMPSQVQDRVENLSRSPELAEPPSKVGLAQFSDGKQVAVALIGELICAQEIASGLTACGRPGVAANGETFSATPVGCDGYSVVGLMPDGIDTLLVDAHGDGSIDSRVPVRSNVYSATFKPVSTVLTSTDGKVQVELPLDWYAEDNDAC